MFRYLQIMEQSVEVIKVILQEQCQRMRFCYFGTPALDWCFWRVGEGCGSFAKAQATARVDVPTTLPLSLCRRSWCLERGPYSCLAMMMKVKHIHTCHSRCICESARERTETSVRDEWKLHFGLQCSRLKICHCRQDSWWVEKGLTLAHHRSIDTMRAHFRSCIVPENNWCCATCRDGTTG